MITYSILALSGVVIAIILDLLILKTAIIRHKVFWVSYIIILGFQLLTNGWLTGRGIVIYSAEKIWGTRVFYAPVEDLLFGFALVLLTQSIWIYREK